MAYDVVRSAFHARPELAVHLVLLVVVSWVLLHRSAATFFRGTANDPDERSGTKGPGLTVVPPLLSLDQRKGLARTVLFITVAVLVGPLFVASVYFLDGAESWGREGRWVSGFLQVYRLAFVLGFAIQITAAALLRWLTRVSGMNGLVHWMAFGAAIGVGLPWLFARLGYVLEGVYFSSEWQNIKAAVMFPLMAAMTYEARPVWVRLAVGAATGGTLRLIARGLVR